MKVIILTIMAIFGAIVAIGVTNGVLRPLYNKHVVKKSMRKCENAPNSRCSSIVEVVMVAYGAHSETAQRISQWILSAKFPHRLRFFVVSFSSTIEDADKQDLADYIDKTPLLKGLNPKGSKSNIAVRVMNVEGIPHRPMGAFLLAQSHFDTGASHMMFVAPFIVPRNGWDEAALRDLAATKSSENVMLTYGIENGAGGSAGRIMTKPTFAVMDWVHDDIVVRWKAATKTGSTPTETKVMCDDLMFMTRSAASNMFENLNSMQAQQIMSWGPSYICIVLSAFMRNMGSSAITPMMPTTLLATGQASANWTLLKETFRSNAELKEKNVQFTKATRVIMDRLSGSPFEAHVLGMNISKKVSGKHGLMGTQPSRNGGDIHDKYGSVEAMDTMWLKLNAKLKGTVTA